MVTSITDYMSPVYWCLNNYHRFNFSIDEIISKFEAFQRNKIDALYITEGMIKEWMKTLDEF